MYDIGPLDIHISRDIGPIFVTFMATTLKLEIYIRGEYIPNGIRNTDIGQKEHGTIKGATFPLHIYHSIASLTIL